MKICIVHNSYGKLSGEEIVVNNIQRLLQERGHDVIPFFRSSDEIEQMHFGRVKAFFSGVYSFSSRKTFRGLLNERKPDIVHIHNLFPLISPSILGECRKAAIPVVMTVHNYRLICPNGLFMTKGDICEACSGGKEYWCILRNCEKSFSKSLGYALRNYTARTLQLFLKNVNLFATLTKFQRQKLIEASYPPERIQIIPNAVSTSGEFGTNDEVGAYVGYIGRVSPEKGISVLLEAARRCPEIPFKVAGACDRMNELRSLAPSNLEFVGHLDPDVVGAFYAKSRIIVLPSIWYEGFPMVIAEAMSYGKAVIVSRIGGFPEIVDDGMTGLMFEPGDSTCLAEKIRYLWGNPDICRRMGKAGKEKASHEYSASKYYDRLLMAYRKAALLRNREKAR